MGATEIIFIFAVYLLLFGAKGIPSLAQTMGQAVRTFRNATDDIQREIWPTMTPHAGTSATSETSLKPNRKTTMATLETVH